MADTEAGAAAPAPPSSSRILTAAVFIHNFLVLASCALLAVLWSISAANAARIVTRRACGEGSPAAAGAEDFFVRSFLAAGMLVVALCFVAMMAPVLLQLGVLDRLLLCFRGSRQGESREQIGGDGAALIPVGRGRDPESARARCLTNGAYGVVTKSTIFSVVMFMVLAVGQLIVMLAPAKGSCVARVGLMLSDMGSFLMSATTCFVILPRYEIQLLGAWAEVQHGSSTLGLDRSRHQIQLTGGWVEVLHLQSVLITLRS